MNSGLDGLTKEDRLKLMEATKLIEEVAQKVRITQMLGKSRVPAFEDGRLAAKLQLASEVIKGEISGAKIRIE